LLQNYWQNYNAELSTSKLHDITHIGMRATIGIIFIVHGFGKFGNPGFGGWISSIGIPAEMQIPIALAEFVPGILLLIGVLTRISGALLSIVMLGQSFLLMVRLVSRGTRVMNLI